MQDGSAYEYLTRIARLLQAEDRNSSPGLQPVQLHALHYLTRCNRYSDRPAAVAEYLGITKGTASQTLRVLLEADLITKRTDADDRRVVRLSLTSKGKQAVGGAMSRLVLARALSSLPNGEGEQLHALLERTLRALQRANQGRSFGVCHTCRHFTAQEGGQQLCGLTLEPLSSKETQLICREHVAASAVA